MLGLPLAKCAHANSDAIAESKWNWLHADCKLHKYTQYNTLTYTYSQLTLKKSKNKFMEVGIRIKLRSLAKIWTY